MQRKITLRILGISLDDERNVIAIADHLDDLIWTVVDGRVRASIIMEQSDDLVCRAVEAARRIEHELVGARVYRVDEELVGIPDISARLRLNRETVRSWVTGSRGPGGFPPPAGSIGGGDRGAAKIWAWAEVNAWLDKSFSLGDGYSYADNAELAEVNAYLARADYIMVANVQNGPIAFPAVFNTQNIDPRGKDVIAASSNGPAEAVYLSVNQFAEV